MVRPSSAVSNVSSSGSEGDLVFPEFETKPPRPASGDRIRLPGPWRLLLVNDGCPRSRSRAWALLKGDVGDGDLGAGEVRETEYLSAKDKFAEMTGYCDLSVPNFVRAIQSTYIPVAKLESP